MVGLVPVPSEVADYGAFFISSYVYLDMCGHGTIGFAKTLAASGEISPQTGSSFTLETPAGVVTVGLVWDVRGRLDRVRLRNVPAFVAIEGLEVEVPGTGWVAADIVYGGMWYALVDARRVGITLDREHASAAMRKGAAIKREITRALAEHAATVGEGAVASVLFYEDEPGEVPGRASARHLLVLESNKFDRSPCGTGTAARLAQLVHQGRLGTTGSYRARNLLDVAFEARVAGTETVGADRRAVVAEIEGSAFITAYATIVKEDGDPLRAGFLCR